MPWKEKICQMAKKSDKSNVKLISVQLLMIFLQPYWWNHTNSQIAASCSLTGLWIDFQLTDDRLNQSSIMKRHKVEISVANSQASDVTLNRWRTVVSATWKYDDPRLNMSYEGAWHVQPRVVIFPCRLTNYELLRWLVETPSRDCALSTVRRA